MSRLITLVFLTVLTFIGSCCSISLASKFSDHQRIRRVIYPAGNLLHQMHQEASLHPAIFHTPVTISSPSTGHRHVNWRGHRRQFKHHMSSNLDHRINYASESAINDRFHEMNNGQIGYNGHHSNDEYFPLIAPLARHRSHQHFSSGKSDHLASSSSSSSSSASSSASSSSSAANDQLATRRFSVASNRFTG